MPPGRRAFRFLPLGHVWRGNGSDDVLLKGATSSDGAVLNFSGNDRFLVAGGKDTIWMGDGQDTGSGGAGADTFQGGFGADVILGGRENDILTGGSGADPFVFASGDGQDRILGFDVTQDVIDVPDGSFTGFQVVEGDPDLILEHGGAGDQIILVNFDLSRMNDILID